MSAASRAAAGSASASQTVTPRDRRASATEVPIRPVPMMTALAGAGPRLAPRWLVHWAISSRSAAAPRRYTCCMAERGLPVSTCMSSRTTRGMPCGTAISVVHSSGTS